MKQKDPLDDLFLKQIKVFGKNFVRVLALLEISAKIPDGQDVRKAAVVFLHASLEEYLRFTEVEVLVTRQIAGAEGYKLNVSLADLHRIYSTGDDSGLREIIERKKRTYNNTRDLENWLNLLKIPVDSPGIDLKPITAMIEKRHKIVHQADASLLHQEVVEGWAESVKAFMGWTATRLVGKDARRVSARLT